MLNEQSFIKKFALDPYTAEEEREAFLNYKADKSIESNIFNHNIPLLSWLMNKYESSAKYFNLSNSDLWEVLMETLLLAISHFDVECGCRFSTFATSCARRELSKIWKKQQSFDRLVAKSNLSLEKLIENETTKDAICVDGNKYVTNDNETEIDNVSYVADLLSHLSSEDRSLVISAYGLFGENRLSLSDIAERNNYSRQYVSAKLKRLQAKLREIAKDMEEQ